MYFRSNRKWTDRVSSTFQIHWAPLAAARPLGHGSSLLTGLLISPFALQSLLDPAAVTLLKSAHVSPAHKSLLASHLISLQGKPSNLTGSTSSRLWTWSSNHPLAPHTSSQGVPRCSSDTLARDFVSAPRSEMSLPQVSRQLAPFSRKGFYQMSIPGAPGGLSC